MREGESERGFTGKVITFTFVYIATANVWLFLSEDQLLLLKCVAISLFFLKVMGLLPTPRRLTRSKERTVDSTAPSALS